MALTTGNILSYASNTWPWAEIAIAPDGSFYSIMDASNGTGIAVLKYNSGTQSWDNYASFEPADVGVSGFSDDLDIAITSNGNIHVVFKYSTYTNDPEPWNSINAPRGVKHGEFNGTTWTFTTVEEGTPVQNVSSVGFDDPQLLVDSNDVVHVTYEHRFYNQTASTREYNLKYAFKNGGSFDVSTAVQWSGASTDSGINEVKEPFIYEGPAGSLYMIYLDEDNFNGSGNLYVKTKPSGGAWSAGQLLLGTPGGPNPNNTLYADTDENGSLHIFYYDGVGEKLYDLNNSSGTFQAEAVLPSLSNIYGFGGYHAIGGKEYIHVSTNNGSVEGHLYSRSAGTGSWTQEFAINGGGADTDFAINSSGEIMFLISDSLGSGPGGDGNAVTFATDTIVSDTTPPAAPSITSISSDTGSSNSDFITNDTSLTITGAAEAGASVAVSDSNGVIGTVTANSSGIWTLVHTFAEGTTSLTAIATDAAGNASSASAAQPLTVDTTQPVAFGAPDLANASDTGSSNSDNITNNTTPTFTGLAEVGATVELFYGGTNSLGSTTVGAGNAWSITATTIPAGDHQITAVVTDAAGNSTTSPALSITVDTTAPSVPSVPDMVVASDLGSSNTDDLTSDTTPTFVGTADAGAIVELFYGGTNSLGTVIADSSGNWTITATTLPEGIQNITALARDAAGNTSAASAALSVTIDTTAPAAPSTPDLLSSSDTGSSNTDNITGDDTPTFAGTAAANATVEVFYGGTNSLGTTSADAAGNWTLTATTMPDGDHNITARVMDAAGNLSPASSGLDITIDAGPASPPTVTSVSPDTGTSTTDGVTNTQTLSFSGTAPANSSVEVFVDNSSIGSTTANALGVWTIASASPLSEGTHAVTAIATTVVGNVSSPSQAYSVTVDTTTPTLSDIDLVDASDDGSSNSDDRTSVRTPTIAYTAEAGSTVEINFGDGNGYQAANPGNGSQQTATLASAYATEGLKAIQVRVTDPAGNQVTKALGIVVNFKPTDITLSSASIAENSAEGSVIGALTVVDPTVVESHTLAITNDPDGLFAIDGGNLVVGAGADLDFEAGETRTVEITATDSIGGQVAVSLDVTLTDVREDIGGTDSADTLSAGAGLDDFTLGEGEDVVETTFDNISGDTFSDFGAGDELIFTDTSFEKDQVTITGTSPYTVEIDRDNDGTADTTFTIESNLEDGEIMVVSRGGETTISQESFLPTLSEGASVDTSNVNGINSQTFLTGTGSLGFRVTIDSTQLGASFKNSLGVYEVDAAGNIIDVRMLVADTTSAVGASVNVTDVEDSHKLGFFIVQNGADFIDGLSNTDTFSFINSQDDTAATLTTGSSTALAVNGSVANVTTFHSIESSLNSDDIQHALSGVNTGGTSITIGFEDMTGGGDRDYQDVVFSVETYDII